MSEASPTTALLVAGWLVGVPVPLVGSVIGGFAGAFVGAAIFEYTRARHSEGAVKAGDYVDVMVMDGLV